MRGAGLRWNVPDVLRQDFYADARRAIFVVGNAVVGSNEDNYDALKEICERYQVRRLDLHGSTSTGEDIPDGQSELNLLVEFLPLTEKEYPKVYLALEEALESLFGREVGLLRTDDLKPELLYRQITKRRTLLYLAEGQDES